MPRVAPFASATERTTASNTPAAGMSRLNRLIVRRAAVGREVLGPAGIVGDRVEPERVRVRRRDELRRDAGGADERDTAPAMIGTLPAVPELGLADEGDGLLLQQLVRAAEDCSGDPSVDALLQLQRTTRGTPSSVLT